MFPLDILHVLADAPFLPRGRGALILIAGGITILLASVLWSLLAFPRKAAPAPPTHVSHEADANQPEPPPPTPLSTPEPLPEPNPSLNSSKPQEPPDAADAASDPDETDPPNQEAVP